MNTKSGLSAGDIADIVDSHQFKFADTNGIADGIRAALKRSGICFEEDFNLEPGLSVQFWIPGDLIAVFVQVGGTMGDAMRTMNKIASGSLSKSIVFVCPETWAARLSPINNCNGKPTSVVRIGNKKKKGFAS